MAEYPKFGRLHRGRFIQVIHATEAGGACHWTLHRATETGEPGEEIARDTSHGEVLALRDAYRVVGPLRQDANNEAAHDR